MGKYCKLSKDGNYHRHLGGDEYTALSAGGHFYPPTIGLHPIQLVFEQLPIYYNPFQALVVFVTFGCLQYCHIVNSLKVFVSKKIQGLILLDSIHVQ